MHEIIADKEQRRPTNTRRGIGKAIAKIELRRMPPTLPVPGKRIKRCRRIRIGDRYGPDTSSRQKFQYITLSLRHAGMALPAYP